ncbi:hypothetical protein EYV94_00580 [Puteibacter caeruleilacunae]|nr:hypothetical protein EYV94_00580 [Puteibacter caeruleilacunae]
MQNDNRSVRVMVDMSATLIHHGHIRLLKRAKNCLSDQKIHLVVGLTTDEEVITNKGYKPELTYAEREEVLNAIQYVDEVVPTTWMITNDILKKYNIDYLIHGSDNSNEVENIIQFPRTEGVSSEELRERALSSIIQKRNSQKPMFTPGPSNLSVDNILDLRAVFGRGDMEYDAIENTVMDNILNLTGHDHIVRMQGSATTAIDVATSNFINGKILVVVSGYYSQRLVDILTRKQDTLTDASLTVINYTDLDDELAWERTFDWIVTAYTETGDAFLSDIHLLKQLKESKRAKLFLDATASINLEDDHDVADVCAFSSCKGLGGLAGAGFITYKDGCLQPENKVMLPWALDINTYKNKMTTGPYHAICSLYSISQDFGNIRTRVRASKRVFMERYSDRVVLDDEHQPGLCTMVKVDDFSVNKGVKYSPRSVKPGYAVICHLGDMFTEDTAIGGLYESLKLEA